MSVHRCGIGGMVGSLVAVLASGCCMGTEATTVWSDVVHRPAGVAAGPAGVAVAWGEMTDPYGHDPAVRFVGLVDPDGAMGPPVRLDSHQLGASVGTRTVLWHSRSSEGCDLHGVDGTEPIAALVDRTTVIPIAMDPAATMHTAVFDGVDYQLVWLTDHELWQRSVGEDGELGPEHDLGPWDASCLYAVTDGVGGLFVLVGGLGTGTVLVIDPATGTWERVWTPTIPQLTYYGAFWFVNEIHTAGYGSDGLHVESIDPATGTSRVRTLTPDVMQLGAFIAGPTRVFASTTTDIVALDANLAIAETFPVDGYTPAVPIDDDFAHVVAVPIDEPTETPGRIELVRAAIATGTETWRVPVVTDSPVHSETECLTSGCADASSGTAAPGMALLVLAIVRRRLRCTP